MAEVQVLDGWGTQTAPSSRTTKPGELYEVLAVEATFNGTGAAGSFVPAVEIISDAGRSVGIYRFAGSLAAGDSATVSFAPFLRSDTGLTGIFYDFENTGDYLDIATTGVSPFSGEGVQFTVSDVFRIDARKVQIFPAGAITSDFDVDADNNVLIRAEQQMNLIAHNKPLFINGVGVEIESSDFYNGIIGATGASISCAGPYAFDLTAGASSFFITIPAGQFVEILDHTSQPIFRVNEDGSLQGKTGKTLTFNL